MRRVALLIGSLVFAIVFAEAALRLSPRLGPRPRWYVGEQTNRPSHNFLYDSVTGWRMHPGFLYTTTVPGERRTITVAANAQGMRDPENFEHACSRPRVVLIGDSFVWGAGLNYEETIGAQLEDSLGHRADVYNLAMPGFGLDQMWMSLRHQALALCPTLIVAGFIDDDWDRSLSAFRSANRFMSKPTFVVDGDSLRPVRLTDPRPPVPVRVVQRYSSIWRLAELALRKQVYLEGGGNWWQLNTMLLAAMSRDAASAGKPILFVRLPAKGGWLAFPALDAWMRARHDAYVDLADPSRRRLDIHLEGNSHFNDRGAAVTAGTIVEWLRSAGPADLRTLAAP